MLGSTDNSHDDNNSNEKRKRKAKRQQRPLTESERGRREEERRRLERKDDVVLGKTSAKRGEVDYALNVKATEEEWLRQASNVEQQVFKLTERGMECLKMLQLEESNEAFDRVFQLRPNAYLWQAGITKFYLGKVKEAADVFARNAQLYESKFGGPASDERIWRDACELKLINSLSRKQRKLLLSALSSSSSSSRPQLRLTTPIPPPSTSTTNSDGLLSGVEPRKVVRIIRDLFSASVERNHYAMIVARAKLRSLAGTWESNPTTTRRRLRPDQKLWKLTSWYYLGLHYDALGQVAESKACMKMALKVFPNSNGQSDDILHTLPLLHMSKRDWFDDDEYYDLEDDNDTEDDDDGTRQLVSILKGGGEEEFQKLSPEFTLDTLSEASCDTLEELVHEYALCKQREEASSSEAAKKPSGISTIRHDTDPLFIHSIQMSISDMLMTELQDALQYRTLSSSGSKKDLQCRLFLSIMKDASENWW